MGSLWKAKWYLSGRQGGTMPKNWTETRLYILHSFRYHLLNVFGITGIVVLGSLYSSSSHLRPVLSSLFAVARKDEGLNTFDFPGIVSFKLRMYMQWSLERGPGSLGLSVHHFSEALWLLLLLLVFLEKNFSVFLFWGKIAVKYIQWPVIHSGKFNLCFSYLWLCHCLWSEVDWFLTEPSGDCSVWKSRCCPPTKLLCGETMLFNDYNSSGLVLMEVVLWVWMSASGPGVP